MKKVTLHSKLYSISEALKEEYGSRKVEEDMVQALLGEGSSFRKLVETIGDDSVSGELEVTVKYVPSAKLAKSETYLTLQAELEKPVRENKTKKYYLRNREKILSSRKLTAQS